MPRDAPASSSSIISNVFSFVSREIDSFVTNATGGSASSSSTKTGQSQAHASSSRVRLPSNASRRSRETRQFKRGREEGEEEGEYTSDVPKRHDRRTRHTRASSCDGIHDFEHQREFVHSSKRAKGRRPSEVEAEEESEEELSASDRPHSPSPPPPPLPRHLRRRLSITMPGSLFARCSSLEPEITPPPAGSEFTDERRVHFAAGIVSPPVRSKTRVDLDENTASSPSASRTNCSTTPAEFRRRAIKSVRDAVQQFDIEGGSADPSLLLPTSPLKAKGGFTPLDKGKGKALASDYEVSDFPSLSRSRDGSAPDFQVADTSGEIRVRGKERELLVAREEQSRKESDRLKRSERENDAADRERDKDRIRALEEEVKRLRDELSKRPTTPFFPPPPPPPPPPPLAHQASQAHAASSAGSDPVLSTARALLKHTPAPVEVPINDATSRTKRKGQPTLNLPSDKMEAFLSEMKNHRLRKVSGGTNGLSSSTSALVGADSSGMRRSASASASTRGVPARFNFGAGGKEEQFKVGEKRKRDETANDLYHGIKRRSTIHTQSMGDPPGPSAHQSNYRTTARSNLPKPGPSQLSHSFPPPSYSHTISSTSRRLPPSSFSEPELTLTTPSLCSDNDNEVEQETDRPPSTPPLLPSAVRRHVAALAEGTTAKDAIEVIDDYDLPPPAATRKEVRHTAGSNDIFSKRPPSSPIPNPSPRKPRPPARPRLRPKPQQENGSDGDDPLALSYTSNGAPSQPPEVDRESEPEPRNTSRAPSRASAPGSRESSVVSGTKSRSQSRRRTLDEELRDAVAALPDDDEDLDSGVLIGVGTKSKRTGFLARGGAGGAPVHMGVGYVEGVEEEEESPRRGKRGKQSTTSKRRNKR